MATGGLGGYRLYGGATRPDAISGLDPSFSTALLKLYEAAPPGVQAELGLNSAYRSIAKQQELWDRSDKTGHSVARPGKSRHNFGTAADLYGFGLGGVNAVSPATRAWVHENAPRFGLNFPMSHEPWHIQMGGSNAAPATYQVGPGFRGKNPAANYATPPPSPVLTAGLGAVPPEAEAPAARGREMLAGLGQPAAADEQLLAMALAAMNDWQAGGQGEPLPQVKIRRTPAEIPKRVV